MKTLIGISIAQTAAIVFLGVQVSKLDAQSDKIRVAAENAERTTQEFQASAFASQRHNDAFVVASPSAAEIREIVRSEFEAATVQAAFEIAQSASPASARSNAQDNANVRPPEETQQLTQSINNDFNAYLGRGRIEPEEMSNLQQKIARLPKQERRKMLNRLTREMNSGALKGFF